MGNLTRDPETRTTPNGSTICKIGLAVNRTFTGQDGQKREEVTFVDCDAFGKTADNISRWMSKGRPILIEGRLRLDQWEDKNTGQARSKLGVTIESFQFVGGRDEASTPQAPAPRPAQRQEAPRRAPQPPQNSADVDDDVPF